MPRYHGIFYPFAGIHIALSTLVVLAQFLLFPPTFSATIEYVSLVLALRPHCIRDIFSSFLVDTSDPNLFQRILLKFVSDAPGTKYAINSVLGLVYDGYFYCFHLFHVIVGNDLLQRVLQVRFHSC
jgi:inositol 1,4,5-triphosphate receptor type 1